MTTSPPPARSRAHQGGFTVVEVMIALVVLLIGILGLLSMQITSIRATGFSRHAAEATVLAEDKMEDLRATPFTLLASSDPDTPEVLDSQGLANVDGLYTREWVVATGGIITVTVAWLESDDPFTITLQTRR